MTQLTRLPFGCQLLRERLWWRAVLDSLRRQSPDDLPCEGFGTNVTTTPIHSNWGWVGGVKFGYMFDSQPLCDWMNLRWQPAVEAKVSISATTAMRRRLRSGSHEEFSTNSGDFFVNGVMRFKNSSIVTPYFGVGAGLQYFTSHTTLHGPPGGFIGRVSTRATSILPRRRCRLRFSPLRPCLDVHRVQVYRCARQ